MPASEVKRSRSGRAANQWDADIALSEEAAVLLIATQFPDLAPVRLTPLGAGWDNLAFLVNACYVFRFPRRQVAVDLIAQEIRALPLLASHLPQPIPVPAFVGAPEARYPYPFAGYALIPGETACRIAWSDMERAHNAVPLARFLAALHAIPVDTETQAWAPKDTIARADIRTRAPRVKEQLQTLAPALAGIDTARHAALLDRLADTPLHAGPLCWVHGDLYARHLLVDRKKLLCGVIDWGDVHLGDPALDLSIAFSFLPAEAREPFRAAYGGIDAAAWDRARFRALRYGVTLIAYGADVGDEAIRSAGAYALHAAMTG